MPLADSRLQSGGSLAENAYATTNLEGFRDWFAANFSLDGKSYTLDLDQARAVLDNHKNTLVTARAGSGKTRVIVAKTAYLLATEQAEPSEIVAFMFNRTAAQEVNERIMKVQFRGRSVLSQTTASETQDLAQPPEVSSPSVAIASTFHKFALDIVKLSGVHPELISEAEHDALVRQSLERALKSQELNRRVSKRDFDELLKTVSGFVVRAGQKYIGQAGLAKLQKNVEDYVSQHLGDPDFSEKVRLHQLGSATFKNYLQNLRPPRIDFNLLMSRTAEVLHGCDLKTGTGELPHDHATAASRILRKVRPLKFIMIDEYQDFSQLFLNLVLPLRENCPSAHLFAVGDDWQAINRFAGSDVDYFIHFADYFSEDVINIPLMTNYRSCRRIVENANDYMLKNYDPAASRAVPFNHKPGKIIRRNPDKTRFDADDIREDALGDARYQLALTRAINADKQQLSDKVQVKNVTPATDHIKPAANISADAAKLLKTVFKILRKNRHSEIMLLHRHNFTTFSGITLEAFHAALKILAVEEEIMTPENFDQQVRCLTMHKSKGLESEVVILLEANRDLVLGRHPNADLWQLFGDSSATEKSDQYRLLYVAMTRAKQKLYILSADKKSPF